MFTEIKQLKATKKSSMKFNEKILKQKEDLEAQVRQMQEDTHKMDEHYKELSTL